MNLNIRDAFQLEDGHNLLATIIGRSVPNEVVVPKMENGSLSGHEMYLSSLSSWKQTLKNISG